MQKILIGLIRDYSGSAQVCGFESKSQGKDFYENIGVDFEFSSLKENLSYFASLYRHSTKFPEMLLELVNLRGDMNKKISAYSKGMKSRLNFVKALLHNPPVLFLDEPTSGLAPSNSRRMKDIILQEKDKGKTIVLTTHNMEDATELCTRVAFIVNGKIKLIDSPKNLIKSRRENQVAYSYVTLEGYEKQRTCELKELAYDNRF